MFSWLEELWNTFKEWFVDVITDFGLWLWELIGNVVKGILDAVLAVIGAIPVPAFLDGGMQGMLSGIDPAVLYFLSQSGFAPGLALIGAGVAFRLIRKLCTLGQW